MKQILIFLIVCFFSIVTIAFADEVPLAWDKSDGALGYKVYMSTDLGTTWNEPIDVGDVLTYVYTDVPSTKRVLFRISAYNNEAEVVRFDAGVWYKGDAKPPKFVSSLGVQ